MGLEVRDWILIVFNFVYIFGFGLFYLLRQNYEFLLYVAILVGLFIFVLAVQRKVKFSYTILWMLSLWGLMHMAGGGIRLDDGQVLYKFIVMPIYDGSAVSDEFVMLKYDQVLHFYIYFVMSFLLVHLLHARMKLKRWHSFVLISLMSMGISVINELVEFGAVVFLGQTGVGGYYNTLLDLCFNTLGAFVGALACFKR